MKIYFSMFHGFENHVGIHLLPDYLYSDINNKNKDSVFFDVYYVKSKNVAKKIGELKLLVKDNENPEAFLKTKGKEIKNSGIYDVSQLFKSSAILSMPVTIDYYKAIANLFSEVEARILLRDIGDISYNKNNLKKYSEWKYFKNKFFRDSSSHRSIIERGAEIATGSYKMGGEVRIELDSLETTFESFDFVFNKDNEFSEDINLLIGKNGLGKTHLLKHICEIFTGLKSAREKPLLNKLVVVSFSPFENFHTKRELTQLIDLNYGKSKKIKSRELVDIEDYSYIGFRDYDGEFHKQWPDFFSAKSIVDAIKYDNEIAWWQSDEYSKFETIFSTLLLSMDFDAIQIKTIKNKFISITPDNYKEIDFENYDEINFQAGVTFVKNSQVVKMSSGQKIFSYMIPSIISEMQDETLLIIDEPELYLHPALEVGLIEMLKKVLFKTRSYAIIATHSAVMAREVRRGCVRILRDSENGTRIDNPSIETYGESLDAIIGEVFDDYSIKKPYQYEIDDMIKSSSNLNKTLKDISKKLGDEALVYFMSQIEGDDDIILEVKK